MVAHEAEAAFGVELLAVEAHDACRFLSPVLQGVQAQSREGRRIGVIEDAKDAAFFVQLIAIEVQKPGLRGVHARNRVQPLYSTGLARHAAEASRSV